MADIEIKLVRLHRCKLCKARMFERDRYGHMARHGMACSKLDIARHFKPGYKDTPAQVGGNYKPLRRPKSQTKTTKGSK